MAILTPYTERVSAELDSFLPEKHPLPLYGMMRYFMGFADEKLRPAKIFGGKRFRSALALLIADAYGELELAVPAALSVELFHNFTLVHDDIIDNDELRRGRPTIWKLWGVPHAINTGDGQLLLVFRALAEAIAKHPERGAKAQQFLVERYYEVVEGQYLDMTLAGQELTDDAVTVDAYFEMIRKKTAELVGAATKAAGIMAGVSDPECEELYRYGRNFGYAIQLHDDYVSIWGEEKVTGKRAYGDIYERKKTLPVIYAREHLPEGEKERLLTLYASGAPTEDDAREIIDLLIDSGAKANLETEIKRALEASHAACHALSISEKDKERLSALYKECMPGYQ